MRYLKMALSLPKIIYFNFKVFPWNIAKKLPVFLHYNVKFGSLYKGCIEIKSSNIHPGMIKLGCSMGSAGVFEGEYPRASGGGYISIRPGCKLVFKGNAIFSGGISLRNDNGGITEFGENFMCNNYCFIAANSLIKFGDNCLLGWKVNIRDSDGHHIYNGRNVNQKSSNDARPVIIGDHVWLASHTHVLKGTVIADETVVAYGSILSGSKIQDDHCIIGGNPTRILKENVSWER